MGLQQERLGERVGEEWGAAGAPLHAPEHPRHAGQLDAQLGGEGEGVRKGQQEELHRLHGVAAKGGRGGAGRLSGKQGHMHGRMEEPPGPERGGRQQATNPTGTGGREIQE